MHKFEPFEQVIVRDYECDTWEIDWFSHYRKNEVFPFVCMSNEFRHCLPYKGNEYLVGTTDSPASPQSELKLGDKVEMRDYDSQDWECGTFVIERKHDTMYPFNVIPDGGDAVLGFAQCRRAKGDDNEKQIDTTFFGPDLDTAIAFTGYTHGFNLVARLNTAGVLTAQRVEILRTWAEKKPELDNVINAWRYWFKAGVITGLNQDPLPTETNLSYWIHALDSGLMDVVASQDFRIP